jgi:osmotically-inducible protein OsmY
MPNRRPTVGETRARIAQRLESVLGASERAIVVVATDDGRVRLEGSVHSLADHSSAVAAARSTPGVVMVEDQLQILLP